MRSVSIKFKERIGNIVSKLKSRVPKNIEYIVLVTIFLFSVSGVIASVNKQGDILGARLVGKQTGSQNNGSVETQRNANNNENTESENNSSDSEGYIYESYQATTNSPMPTPRSTVRGTSTSNPGQGQGNQGNGNSGTPGSGGTCNNNGTCNGNETQASCPADCSPTQPPVVSPAPTPDTSVGGGSGGECNEFEHGKKAGECKPGGKPN